MAALEQFSEKYIDMPDGKVIGIHKVTLISSSDTFIVPLLENTTSGASVAHLRTTGQAALTVANSTDANNDYIVTITGGSAGDVAYIVTLHSSHRRTTTVP